MQELGLRGNKIKLLQDAGYSFEDACTYVRLQDVEHEVYNNPLNMVGVDFNELTSEYR